MGVNGSVGLETGRTNKDWGDCSHEQPPKATLLLIDRERAAKSKWLRSRMKDADEERMRKWTDERKKVL
jgi:hypothetical protein